MICSGCLLAKLSLTLCDPMDYSLPGSSVHGIFQARILVWVAISCSQGSFQPKDQTSIFCTDKQILYQLNHLESPKRMISSLEQIIRMKPHIPWGKKPTYCATSSNNPQPFASTNDMVGIATEYSKIKTTK